MGPVALSTAHARLPRIVGSRASPHAPQTVAEEVGADRSAAPEEEPRMTAFAVDEHTLAGIRITLCSSERPLAREFRLSQLLPQASRQQASFDRAKFSVIRVAASA